MPIGNVHAQGAILSHELQPDVYALYLDASVSAITMKHKIEQYANTIDVPDKSYGSDGGYSSTGPVYSKINNIKMKLEDQMGRYINYGVSGLSGSITTGNLTGTFNPFDAEIAGYTPNSAGTIALADLNIQRDYRNVIIPEGHAGLQSQISSYDTDLLGRNEISGEILRMGRVKWEDVYNSILIPNKDTLYKFKQMGEMAGTYTAQFYRDRLVSSASQFKSGTGTDLDCRSNYTELIAYFDAISEELEFHGAEMVSDIIYGSTRVGSKAIDAGYICPVNTKLKKWIEKMPGVTLIKEYPENPKNKDEFASYGNIRFVVEDTLYNDAVMDAIPDPSTASGDFMTAGAKISYYNFLVFGKDAFTMLKMRGTKNYELKLSPAEKVSQSNPLGLFGTMGWLGYVGFLQPKPLHVWNARVRII